MASSETGSPVQLYIYDLSQGMASLMAPLLIDRAIDGIWHTSIVVFGTEYFFGSTGVKTCAPGGSVLGQPLRREPLGDTFVPASVFRDYVQALAESRFAGPEYSLLRHNCNHFSDEVAQFLVGSGIPKYILELPEVLLSTALGRALQPLLAQLDAGAQSLAGGRRPRDPSPDLVELTSQIEQARCDAARLEQRRSSLTEKLARKERRRERRRRRQRVQRDGSSSPFSLLMADEDAATEPLNGAPAAPDPDEEERRADEERRRQREPPIVFPDAVDVRREYEALVDLLDGRLAAPELQAMAELRQYALEDEGSWVLGDDFLGFVGRLLHDGALPGEVRVHALHVLAAAALKDDVVLLLHQDRRDHVLMSYAHRVEWLPPPEQLALALFFVNLFEGLGASEWLLYISEWAAAGQQTSNIRCTTRVAVHALLSDLPELQARGAALVHNLACKDVKTVVFDDVAVELTMALLQFLAGRPAEEPLFRAMKSLARLANLAGQEVPQLVQLVGPHPDTFRGVSARVDQQVAALVAKLR